MLIFMTNRDLLIIIELFFLVKYNIKIQGMITVYSSVRDPSPSPVSNYSHLLDNLIY
mgnify:CR=1 FL=1